MSSDRPEVQEKSGPFSRLNLALFAALAVVLLALAGYTAYLILNPVPVDRYTELSLLGPNGTAVDYPTQLVIGENKTLVAWVANREHQDTSYELAVDYNNSSKVETAYRDHIYLMDNDTWTKRYMVQPDIPGDKVKVEFKLYKEGQNTTPYRECYLWLNVSEPYNYTEALQQAAT